MLFCSNLEHATPLYKLLDILTLDSILRFKAGLLAHQIINHNQTVPTVFTNIFKLAKHQHHYNTRFATKENITRTAIKTNYGKFTFKFSISQIWELIPTNIKNINSHALFKKTLKVFLLASIV